MDEQNCFEIKKQSGREWRMKFRRKEKKHNDWKLKFKNLKKLGKSNLRKIKETGGKYVYKSL